MSKRITTFCTDLIVRSGPQPLDVLAERVSVAGLTTARKPETTVKSALGRSAGIVRLPDGRYDAVRRMLDGAVLTHRVRAATAGRHVLFAGHELELFDELLAAGPLPLASGGEVSRSRSDLNGLFGPPGWLPDVPADSLLALRFSAGVLAVTPVEDTAESMDRRTARLLDVVSRHVGAKDERPAASWTYGHDEWPDYSRSLTGWRRILSQAMLRALAECPDLLAEPVPPLDEVLRLPEVSWSEVWADQDRMHHGVSSPQRGVTLTLHGVPEGLRTALQQQAVSSRTPLGEFVVLQLAAATYRWETPCRHDAEQAWLERFRADERGRVMSRYDALGYGEDDPEYEAEPPYYPDVEPPAPDEPGADVVPLMPVTRPAGPAGSSAPHSGTRPR